ncbi:MAG: hypothetical protein NZ805_01780 [Armatimonadetes bacterium]|nr:hypothetical protein [Armatimonadota bacterium]MDW8027139.1 hypothetical protein [Armatimonadota bacterium]
MKRWLMVCFALSFFQLIVAPQIANGGFEELDENRFPINWSWFASRKEDAVVRVTTDAAEGRFALYMESRSTATVGVNRTYRAGKHGEFVPDIGAMLPFKKGVLIFRYKVVKAASDNVRVYAIPMKADNIEGGASRFVYTVSPKFAGDNKWHVGVLAFDFSDKPEVRSVQIGLRINEGGQPAPAAVIFDDFRFVEKAGWHLRLDSVRFEEGTKPGEQGYLVLRLQNTGDEPAPLNAELKAQQNFETEPVEIPSSVSPQETVTLRWFVKGSRKVGTKFVIRWESMSQTFESLTHVCSAQLKLISFGFANAVLFVGAPTQLRLVLENSGDALIEGINVQLALQGLALVQGSLKKDLSIVPPGKNTVSWIVVGKKPSEYLASVQIQVGRTPFNMVAKGVVSRPIRDRDKGTLIVATKNLRLLFPSNPFGYGVFAVEVYDGKVWRKMALSPQLLLVSYFDVRRQAVTKLVFATKFEKLPNGGLAFPFQWQDEIDGGVWKGEVRFDPDGNAIKVGWQLNVTQIRQILAVQSPLLFVGDQDFGVKKSMALLPGAYWLLEDETVDDARYSDPPNHLHIVPHPYKLTQPLMAISQDNIFVGLIWDALQQWTEGEGQGSETGLCPQPIFAVPNIIANQNNHLLGLMVPNVPKWLKENSVWAQNPFKLTPKNKLRLSAWVIGGKGNVLDAYDAYFAKFTLPMIPERPYPDEETFSRSKVGIRSDRYGKLFAELLTLERQAMEDAKTQREDGSWGFALDRGWTLEMLRKFAPHRNLEDYGKEGDTTVGTCTFLLRRAVALLRYARMTGSTESAKLGMKAIHFIDKNFVRPEGAQTWEIPLHCPDVLASANAIHAYLEAWQLTNDTYWLERAIYWAKTGLPFIYFWNTPDRPTMMRYASIPVFGTSFFSAAPWFGTPVQWNGLDYAYALLKLANALSQSPVHSAQSPEFWRQIAEGITVCGIQHQASVNHPEGNYPDSVALTYRYGPNDKGIISPYGIVRNLWLLRDYHDDAQGYETVVVKTEPPIRITSDGIVEGAEWKEGELTIILRTPKGVTQSQTIIACVTKPNRVFVNERLLFADDFKSPVPTSFRYDPRRKIALLQLHHENETLTVKLMGIKPAVYDLLGVIWERPVWEFNFDDDPDGWIPVHDLEPFEVKGGILKTRSTGNDPYMHSPPIQIEAAKFRTLILSLKVQFPEGAHPIGQVFWVSDDDPNWSESKSVKFPIPTDGQWHELKVELSQSSEWRGTITQLRLDLGGGAGIIAEIDFVRLE